MGIRSTAAIKEILKQHKKEKRFCRQQGWAARRAQDTTIFPETRGKLRVRQATLSQVGEQTQQSPAARCQVPAAGRGLSAVCAEVTLLPNWAGPGRGAQLTSATRRGKGRVWLRRHGAVWSFPRAPGGPATLPCALTQRPRRLAGLGGLTARTQEGAKGSRAGGVHLVPSPALNASLSEKHSDLKLETQGQAACRRGAAPLAPAVCTGASEPPGPPGPCFRSWQESGIWRDSACDLRGSQHLLWDPLEA